MSKPFPCPDGRNTLLATLSDADRALLEPHLETVELPVRTVLERPGQPIERVHFPLSAIGSVIALGRGGRRIEAGLFGCEGMSGTPLVTGDDRSPNETVVQVAGRGRVIDADRLRAAMEEAPGIRRHFLLYVQVLHVQTAQTAMSNGQAKLEERLARWLLMCHDRIDGDSLALTHEFLSVMLGVRRAGVTVGIHLLEGKALIRGRRGQITILDREGLEAEARGSYGVPEAEYARLLIRDRGTTAAVRTDRSAAE